MSSSVLDRLRNLLFHFAVIFVIVFLQFVFLNIMPGRINEVDLFLIMSALYILKTDFETSFLFLFGSVFVDEVVFPVAKIIGVKVLSALVLGYILYILFKKMMLKGWLLCLTVSIYCLLVFLVTKLILVFLNYSSLTINVPDFFWVFFNSFFITCLVGKRFNVR